MTKKEILKLIGPDGIADVFNWKRTPAWLILGKAKLITGADARLISRTDFKRKTEQEILLKTKFPGEEKESELKCRIYFDPIIR